MDYNKIWPAVIAILIIAAILFLFRKHSKAKKLFIVGNGFDLYHGIPSGYLQFRDYLFDHDREVYDALEEYIHLDSDAEWRDFESNLANLDADQLIDENSIFLGDGEKASDWGDFQYEVSKMIKRLGEQMKTRFLEWILQLPIIHSSSMPKLVLAKNELYLNFNYTNSLEQLYGIPRKNILYIHGKAVNNSSSIVLGHSWENYDKVFEEGPLTYEDFKDGNYSTEKDWRVEEAKEDINSYFESSYKNSAEIIKINKRFFEDLKGIKEIYVMGHSMSEVDMKYFKEIAWNIDTQKVKWTVSNYTTQGADRCKGTLTEAGIDIGLVDFKLLKDFF